MTKDAHGAPPSPPSPDERQREQQGKDHPHGPQQHSPMPVPTIAPQRPLRHVEKRRRPSSASPWADRVAEISLRHYRQLVLPHLDKLTSSSSGQVTCLATLVAQERWTITIDNTDPLNGDELEQVREHDRLTVVAMGVGTKFLSEALLKQEYSSGGTVSSVQGPTTPEEGTPPSRSYGHLVRDAHAEVLARRAFRRFLTLQLLSHHHQGHDLPSQSQQPPEGRWQCGRLLVQSPATATISASEGVDDDPAPRRPRFQVHRSVTWHMYTSSAPCGNAVLKKFANLRQEMAEEVPAGLGPTHWLTSPHPRILASAIPQGQFALLVKKDPTCGTAATTAVSTTNHGCDDDNNNNNEGNIKRKIRKEDSWPMNQCTAWCPPGTTTVWSGQGSLHTCSDKICRWNCLGLQGSLLASCVDPVFLSTLTVGRKLNTSICRRAVCCRVGIDPRAHGETASSSQAVRPDPSHHGRYRNKGPVEDFPVHHPAILGTAVYMDEAGTREALPVQKDGSSSNERSQLAFPSLCWVWWLDDTTDDPNGSLECIDGSTGWAMSYRDGQASSMGKGEKMPSRICTAALSHLFEQAQAALAENSCVESNSQAKSRLPTTLHELRTWKKAVSPVYEAKKDHFLQKHTVLCHWKRRELSTPTTGANCDTCLLSYESTNKFHKIE